jgi:hypothetical protein
MYDTLYVIGTLVFFAAMLGFVRVCALLGDKAPEAEQN